ncbi:MAG: phosphate ABC transporter substrate-binding protein [Cellulosilyticaceae bacterium]
MKKRLAGIIGAMLIGTMVFAGCGTKGSDSSKISVVGSTTIAPPMEELAAVYSGKNPSLKIEVQGVGSSAGIKAASDGTAQIGMSSRVLKDEEKSLGLVETTIAYDGIAVVTHPSNPVKDLSKDQIKDIFQGKIKNWKEVGGNDQDIILVARESGSGTRDAFEEILKLQEEKNGKKVTTIASTALISEGNGSVKATIASKEAAVGFVSIGYLDETVKAVKVDGIEATEDAVKDSTYMISRPLLVLTKPDASKDVQEFVKYIVGDEGQKIMSEKYVSIK